MAAARTRGTVSRVSSDRAKTFEDVLQLMTQAMTAMQEVLTQREMKMEDKVERALRQQEQRAKRTIESVLRAHAKKEKETEEAMEALRLRVETAEEEERARNVEARRLQEKVEALERRVEAAAGQEVPEKTEIPLQQLEDSTRRTPDVFSPRVEALEARMEEHSPPEQQSEAPSSSESASSTPSSKHSLQKTIHVLSSVVVASAGQMEGRPPPEKQPDALTSAALSSLTPSSRSSLPRTPVVDSLGVEPSGAQMEESPPPDEESDASSSDSSTSSTQSSRHSSAEIPLAKSPLQRVTAERRWALENDLKKAAQQGKTDEVRRLLDCGVHVNTVDSSRYTALMHAAKSGHASVVALLLARGANVHAKSRFVSYTALHEAALNDLSGRCVALLVEAGSDVHCAANWGRTPLHLAASKDNMAAARVLLRAGARRTSEDQDQKTPFQLTHSAALRKLLRQ